MRSPIVPGDPWQELALQGIVLDPRMMRDRLRISNPDDVVGFFRAMGIGARPVYASIRQVEHLRIPVLVQRPGGGWAAMRISGARFELVSDGEDGEREGDGSSAELETIAVELEPVEVERVPFGWIAQAKAALARSVVQRRALINVLVGALFGAGLSLLAPLILLFVVDDVLPGAERNALSIVVVASLAIMLQRSVSEWARATAGVAFTANMEALGRGKVMRSALRLPFGTLQERGAAPVFESLPSVSLAFGSSGQMLDSLVFDAGAAACTLVLAATLSPKYAMFFAVAATLAGLLNLFSGARVAELSGRATTASAPQYSALVELVTGVVGAKISNAEGDLTARWWKVFLRGKNASHRATLASVDQRVFFEFLDGMVALVGLLWVGQQCLDGAVSLGGMVATVQAGTAFWLAARKCGTNGVAMFGVRQHVLRLNKSLSSSTPVKRSVEVGANVAGICVQDLWFRFDENEPWIFQGLTLTVPRGETMTLSWPSGAGKTTLLRLLAGLYAPERGTVVVGGHDPRRAEGVVGYVPQEPLLFEGSVRDNLHILSGGADAMRLAEASRATGLSEVALGWPMHLETRLSARGGNISAGQRQLVMLTACIASCRPVLLLDEAFANLDGRLRARIARSPLFHDRTVLSISHFEVAAP